jgi:hypothetical protein
MLNGESTSHISSHWSLFRQVYGFAYRECLDYTQCSHVREVLAPLRRYSETCLRCYQWSCFKRIHKPKENNGGLAHVCTLVKTATIMNAYWSDFEVTAHNRLYWWMRIMQFLVTTCNNAIPRRDRNFHPIPRSSTLLKYRYRVITDKD